MKARYLLSDIVLAFQVLSGLVFLVVAARFAWFGLGELRAHAAAIDAARLPPAPGEKSLGNALSDSLEAQKEAKAQLEAIMTESNKLTGSGGSEPAEPEVRKRQILVDFGPGRSEVYINGRLLGHTPFAGQISCRDGDQVRIDVVPPEGLPLQRTATCQGDSFHAAGDRADRAEPTGAELQKLNPAVQAARPDPSLR